MLSRKASIIRTPPFHVFYSPGLDYFCHLGEMLFRACVTLLLPLVVLISHVDLVHAGRTRTHEGRDAYTLDPRREVLQPLLCSALTKRDVQPLEREMATFSKWMGNFLASPNATNSASSIASVQGEVQSNQAFVKSFKPAALQPQYRTRVCQSLESILKLSQDG